MSRSEGDGEVQTYVIVRRSGWRTAEEFERADQRATVELEQLDQVVRVRSYVLDERDGSVGTLCIYAAESPEALRRHASAAGLPLDEIVKVAEIVIGTPDRDEATAE